MIRRVAWLGLCLGLSSTALAESAVPLGDSGTSPTRIAVPSEIPSNGVLPIFGRCRDASCSNLQPIMVVETSSGTPVAGHTEVLRPSVQFEGGLYFVPSVPFRSDAGYTVRVPNGHPGGTDHRVWVSAAAHDGLDESAVRATGELLKHVRSLEQKCCSPGYCIDVTWSYTIGLSATLLAARPDATQYLYELSMHAQSEAAGRMASGFHPLQAEGLRLWMGFDGASDSYCYTVRARPIIGGDPFQLMTRCIANEFTDFGPHMRSPEELAQWVAACPPSAASADAGSAPSDLADASTDADGEPLRPSTDTSAVDEESGCRLAAGGSRTGSTPSWLLALVALALARSGGNAGKARSLQSRREDW